MVYSGTALPMRFRVLTAVSMKVTVFWGVAPCSLVEVYRPTTRRNTPEGSHLQLYFTLQIYCKELERLRKTIQKQIRIFGLLVQIPA
jgi:hypothetical protein